MPRKTFTREKTAGSREQAAQLGSRATAFEQLAIAASDEEEALERVLRTLARVSGGAAAVTERNGSVVVSAPQDTAWEPDQSHDEVIEHDVCVSGSPIGVLLLQAGNPDSELIAFASTLLGGVFTRYRTKLSDRRRLADQVLHDVLCTALPDDVVVRRLESFGITFDGANQVLIGSAADPGPGLLDEVPLSVGTILREGRETTLRGVVADEAVVIVPASSAQQAASVLHTELIANGTNAAVGVGGPYPDPTGLRISYSEARAAAQNGPGVHPGEPLFLAGFVRIAEPEDVVMELAEHALVPLFSQEELATGRRDQTTGLVTTLELFLSSDCSYTRTAGLLEIHPNTVRYRVRKMEQLTGLDLSSFKTRVHFWLCLAAARHSSSLPSSSRELPGADE